jgi:hypothetical protein
LFWDSRTSQNLDPDAVLHLQDERNCVGLAEAAILAEGNIAYGADAVMQVEIIKTDSKWSHHLGVSGFESLRATQHTIKLETANWKWLLMTAYSCILELEYSKIEPPSERRNT